MQQGIPPLGLLVEVVERDAREDWFRAAPQDFRKDFGLRIAELGSARWFAARRLAVPLYNRVLGLGLDGPAEGTVRQAVSMYAEAKVKSYFVQVPPWAELGESVFELRVVSRWAKLYRADAPPEGKETDLRIEEVGLAHRAAFGPAACAGFGRPPPLVAWFNSILGRTGWRAYVAFDGAFPIATAALFAKDGTGWLGLAATLPSHRRRGAHGALLTRRLRDGVAMGCRAFATETAEDTPESSNPSLRNLLRAGFEIVHMRSNYSPPFT
jgi:hypothetical protein